MSFIETFLIGYFSISFLVLTLVMIKSYRKKLLNQEFFDSLGTPALFAVYIVVMMIAPPIFIGAIIKKLVFTK